VRMVFCVAHIQNKVNLAMIEDVSCRLEIYLASGKG
jgi:hypothetical protein